ncbi:HNH endonuclease [Tersicoccus phoenicis]|nr:HNH endonuclease [Tersicoccus phoenicis]
MQYVEADWQSGRGCWLWSGMKLRGRGRFKNGGKGYQAARFAFEFIGGQTIPEGMDVDHVMCPDVSCVRPAHLQLATRSDNLRLHHARRKYTPPEGMELVPPQKAHSMRELFVAMEYDLPTIFHHPGASQLVEVPFISNTK